MHTAGRAGARQLAPEDRRQVEADEIVECAARQIGIDQRDVDVARVGDCFENRLLGDGVEGDALHRFVAEHLLLLQKVEHVPGNGFAFAIRVGCQNEAVSGLYRVGNVLHALGRGAIDLPGHFEVLIRTDRTVLRRQIAHMAKRSQHLVVRPEVLVDRLCLGRRLHHYNIHRHFLRQPVLVRASALSAPCVALYRCPEMDRDSCGVKRVHPK
ncbi:hypothetical protein D9M70_423570 [compost metagenome]